MNTTLKKLWNGELSPWSAPDSDETEYRNLITKVEKQGDVLMEKMDEEGRKSFEKLEEAYSEWMSMERENSFLKGFSLGMKMAEEAFCIV